MYADICKLFGIKYPIIQGAMAWISDADLVAAVSNAGGMGVLATGHLDGEGCRKEIKRLKSMTDKPFAVNVMLLSEYVDEIVDVICEEKVPVVTTGAGSPSTKCVGTPFFSSTCMSIFVILLFIEPFPTIVPFFSPLKAVASSL